MTTDTPSEEKIIIEDERGTLNYYITVNNHGEIDIEIKGDETSKFIASYLMLNHLSELEEDIKAGSKRFDKTEKPKIIQARWIMRKVLDSLYAKWLKKHKAQFVVTDVQEEKQSAG